MTNVLFFPIIPAKTPLFEKGSVVALAEGGAPMLVIGYTDEGLVLASWFRKDKDCRTTDEFNPEDLRQICGSVIEPMW